MYKVQILPKAEEDICANTDYIAFAKKHRKRHCNWQEDFIRQLPNLNLCRKRMHWMTIKNLQ